MIINFFKIQIVQVIKNVIKQKHLNKEFCLFEYESLFIYCYSHK